jgi:sugar (pentulose or hexulose) kinase
MCARGVVLGLDSGSQSARAILFDAGGTVLGVGRGLHAAMRHPAEGAVEQDPLDLRDRLFDAIRQALADWGGDPGKIAGAALTTQRSTVLLVDDAGRPLTDAVSWLDRRVASIDSEPSPWLRAAFRAMGKDGLVPRLVAKSWPRQWRQRDPETLRRAAKIAPVEAFLHHALVGRVVLAPGGVVGPWPFDVKRRAFASSPVMHALLGFEPRWLPDVVEAGGAIGRVTPGAAKATGLPAGLPLFACGGDKQAEALAGGVRAGDGSVAAVSLGTGSSIGIPWARPVTHARYHWITMASAEPGSWTHEYLVFRGMWTARWFAREFGGDLADAAAKSDRPVEALLCDEAALVPAGADGMVVWPRWSPTLQHPMETGACVGLRETHGRGHFFRALLEGIGYDLRRGRSILEKALGVRVREVRVGGGGARADLVVQVLADVLNVPVVRPRSEELAARGAAIVAAVGGGVHPSIADAIGAMVPDAPVVRPDPDNAARYDRLYREVFLPGLDVLRRVSGRLRG